MRAKIIEQVKIVSELLVDEKMMVAVAESCTGGMLAEALTSISGSSQWFDRGFVTYSNESKIEMLGVHQTTLTTHGAVSAATVEEMAVGAMQSSHAQLTVAISGIAGPTGGYADKPVGTVWISWAGHHISVVKQKFIFQGDRDAIRQQATLAALEGMIKLIHEKA